MQGYESYVVRTMRAQYKIPDHIRDLPTIREWMRRMGATKFMIRRMEEAMAHAKEEAKKDL